MPNRIKPFFNVTQLRDMRFSYKNTFATTVNLEQDPLTLVFGVHIGNIKELVPQCKLLHSDIVLDDQLRETVAYELELRRSETTQYIWDVTYASLIRHDLKMSWK